MKNLILNQTVGNIHHSLFQHNARDHASEPYFYLQNEFKKQGYDFCGVGTQNINDAAAVFFWDCIGFGGFNPLSRAIRFLKQVRAKAPTRNLITEVMHRKDILKVLVLFEPPSVSPVKKEHHDQFDLIFTWNPTLIDHKKYFPIVLPSPVEFKSSNKPVLFQDKKLLVDVSSYKYNYHTRSLSAFRIEEIRYFQEHYQNQFDLFGEQWNLSFKNYLKRKIRDWRLPYEYFPSYRGTVAHKWDLFPQYKFSLCYENIRDEPGFVSVKIFDCLRSGCVPVYRGAPDIADYVDEASFIDRRHFKNAKELGAFLFSMTEAEHQSYLIAAKKYLSSSRFERFLSPSFANDVIQVTQAFLGVKNRQ